MIGSLCEQGIVSGVQICPGTNYDFLPKEVKILSAFVPYPKASKNGPGDRKAQDLKDMLSFLELRREISVISNLGIRNNDTIRMCDSLLRVGALWPDQKFAVDLSKFSVDDLESLAKNPMLHSIQLNFTPFSWAEMSKPVETLDKNSLAYKAKKFLQIHKGNENDLQVVFGGHLFWFPTKFSSDAKILDIKFATQSLRIFHDYTTGMLPAL